VVYPYRESRKDAQKAKDLVRTTILEKGDRGSEDFAYL
jgi:hypothetical protein